MNDKKDNKDEGESEKGLASYFSHLRLVHFALTVVDLTALYALISAYPSEAPLRHELERLTNLVEKWDRQHDGSTPLLSEGLLNRGSLSSSNVAQWIFDNVLLKSVVTPKGFTVDVGRDESVRVVKGESIGPTGESLGRSPGGSIETVRAWFERSIWHLSILTNFAIPKARIDGITNWVATATGHSYKPLIVLYFWQSKDPPYGKVGINVSDRLLWSDSGRSNAPPLSNSFPVECSLESVNSKTQEGWFTNKFPIIQKHWDVIKDYSLEDALKKPAQIIFKGSQPEPLDVFGLRLDGKSLGAMAPLVIAALLLYLYALVNHFISLNVTRTGVTVPWIGLLSDPVATSLTVLSLILLPAAAIGGAAFLLLGFPLGWAGVFAILACLPGIGILCLRRKANYQCCTKVSSK